MSRRDDRLHPPLFPAPAAVRLVPLQPEPPSADLLRWLASALQQYLHSPVPIVSEMPAERTWRVGDSAQLSSSAIVDTLMERFPGDTEEQATWTLGLTSCDLVGGGRAFVFGEATRGGAWAVVSSARLGAPGTAPFRERLLKESLHELGHLAGLGHCAGEDCLMAAAVDIIAVDRRPLELCRNCRAAL